MQKFFNDGHRNSMTGQHTKKNNSNEKELLYEPFNVE